MSTPNDSDAVKLRQVGRVMGTGESPGTTIMVCSGSPPGDLFGGCPVGWSASSGSIPKATDGDSQE
ncbi:hypothetical protein ACFL0L_00340 [Patescibacteria group bacterium]